MSTCIHSEIKPLPAISTTMADKCATTLTDCELRFSLRSIGAAILGQLLSFLVLFGRRSYETLGCGVASKQRPPLRV